MAVLQLTAEQVAHFDNQGYLVLRAAEHRLVEPAVLQQWTEEVKEWPRENGKWMPYDEITKSGERQLMRTENFASYHAGFESLLFGPALTGILAQLTRDDMMLFKEKINYKLPGGNGFSAHLDAPAYDHMGKIEHTTANLAVDAATVANGCVEVVPGSHRVDVKLTHGGAICEEWEATQTWIPVELASGDLMMFGSHLAHRSASNHTSKARASVYATYHNQSDGQGLREKYYADRRENFPPDHGELPGVAILVMVRIRMANW
nr:putative phytanoyl-coa dioxygenase [Quercus suber]POF00897.1 putative phytanoyl-coa dioxygenase [Quercus suber]